MPLRLPRIFSDACILQQSRPIPVWGWDTPGQVVRVTAGPHQETTTADEGGRWCVQLPPLQVGGPIKVIVAGSSTITLNNVLVGEVWIASGQSNMEWTVSISSDAEREMAAANYPSIRLFKIDRATAFAPQDDVSGAWAECSPESVAEFSAVAYHFARELHASLNIPIGIIQAAWGGTRVEAWTSEPALRKVMDLDPDLAQFPTSESDVEQLTREHMKAFTEWEMRALPADPENTGHARGWHTSSFDDRDWPEMRLPTFWQSRGLDHNGTAWFRRRVQIPQAWLGKEIRLKLGAIDDYDTTYINGEQVGAHPKGTPAAYSANRTYTVPARLTRDADLTIAVRVFDHFGQGGFAGPVSEMRLEAVDGSEAAIPLDGPWRYKVEHAIPKVSADVFRTAPPMPWQAHIQNRAAVLFNAMIHPIVGFGIRGAIWYQGESNVDKWDSYRKRFTAMIRDWRTRWTQGQFPFLFVQLANFGGGPAWAYLQEAQTHTLAEPNTGMALAIDIGDPTDIHPTNKREVGRRLSLLARHRTYAQPVVDRGPHLDRVTINGSIVAVRFHCLGALGTTDGGSPREFEIAGRDGRFSTATAEVRENMVVLTSPAIAQPVAVRYAFRDTPICNLTDDSGLPAEPFRTDGW